MKNTLTIALGLAFLTLVTSFDVGAVDGPHVDPNKVVNTSCTSCHNSSLPSDSVTFNSNCLSCHNDFSSGTNSSAKQTSHNWIGNVTAPAAGAKPPLTGALSQVQNYTASQLACVSCHNPHTDGNTKYQRIANDKDQLCLDCHRSRNTQAAATGSHPVLIGYSSSVKAASDKFVGKVPVNANPVNPTSNLGSKLSRDGKLLCSTCHGVHSADSRSSNYTNGFKNISTGDGNLLRTNPRGEKVASGATDKINICTNCHAGKMSHNGNSQDIQCIDCHGAHVEYDPKDPTNTKGTNVNLIRRNVTKSGQPTQIFFRYTGSSREYKNAAGTGVCQGCHDVPNTIADHVSTDPNVCNKCHSHNYSKGSFSASMPDHKATLGSGDILMFTGNSTHDVTPLSISENCTLCHYESLVQQHNSNCALCHSGANPPRKTITGAWNKTCQQAACHPTIHAAMGADHNRIYWNSSASCELCHDNSTTFPNPADNCTRCHGPSLTAAAVGDHQPPTTTANAQSSYVGPAAIHLSATDAGSSGVSYTYFFHPTHNRWEVGNDVYYSAPTSGSKVYTLSFYSIDHAMNLEAVKTVTFTIAAASDNTPPVTTSSFNPGTNALFKANQTVTLAATDSGSGVKATYFTIDSGAYVLGTSFSVSGDGLHTYSYYSVDNANNTEASHVSNSFRIDTVAPVTTNSALAGTIYTGPQTFILAATDSGSGVASTWYKLDSGALTSGTSVTVAAPSTGSASHTISWYSLDSAGNQEVTKSVTFIVQAPVTDTTPPATTSDFVPAAGAIYKTNQTVSLAATDGVSGVKATYYTIDSGAVTQGASFTISEGLHTFSYYSVDNANNTETTHVSNSFRIDTVAPVTTNSAVAGTTYTGAQTFSLTAADTGGSGVASIWYKLDSGAFATGTSVAVAAPASGSASHTISWYSLDSAGNQEATKSVAFAVAAVAGPPPTTTLSFRTNASFGGWSYVTWEVHDADGNVVNDINGNPCTWWNDDPGHPSSMWIDYVVPAGVKYTMYGAWGPMPDGPDVDSGSRDVSPAEVAPGTTITWWWN